MKTNMFALLSFLSIIFFSCQKEVDFAINNNNNLANERLVRIVEKDGTDSAMVTYSYDVMIVSLKKK